jgi:Flp pilus assembly protein TadG
MRRRRTRGVAALEFLLVLPLFVVVFLMTTAIGQYLVMEYQLGNAATLTAHRCVAYARVIAGRGGGCPAAGTVIEELQRSPWGRTCDDVQATAQQVSLGDGSRYALVIDASCRLSGGAGALLESGVFGVRLPRVAAHATAPLLVDP